MAWCLSLHAPYRCRHAGACCRAAWTIPFEDGTIAARETGGACSFLDGTSHLCSIHSTHGLHALPVTCRMFPRIVLHDMRGTFISLSHFCPTAAQLLFDWSGDVAIVEAPRTLSDIGELEGLDARREWPPLLRPRLLMDPDSYAAWERSAVSLLTRNTMPPEEALSELAEVTASIVTWVPGTSALQDVVRTAFDRHMPTHSPPPATKDVIDAAVKRWLAARLFGTWTAYQGDGLEATLDYLRACLRTFTAEVEIDGNAIEAIRRSDLRILHSAAPGAHGRDAENYVRSL
jgi:hypothetical protein